MRLAIGFQLRIRVLQMAEHVAHPPLVGQGHRQQPLVPAVHIDLVKQGGGSGMVGVAVTHHADDGLLREARPEGGQSIRHAEAGVKQQRPLLAHHNVHIDAGSVFGRPLRDAVHAGEQLCAFIYLKHCCHSFAS